MSWWWSNCMGVVFLVSAWVEVARYGVLIPRRDFYLELHQGAIPRLPPSPSHFSSDSTFPQICSSRRVSRVLLLTSRQSHRSDRCYRSSPPIKIFSDYEGKWENIGSAARWFKAERWQKFYAAFEVLMLIVKRCLLLGHWIIAVKRLWTTK